MIAPLILLVSLVGILWIAMGRPQLGHGGHSDSHHHHSRSLGRKAVMLGGLALVAGEFARHALVIIGGLLALFLLFAVVGVQAIRRHRRRRQFGHYNPPPGYFR